MFGYLCFVRAASVCGLAGSMALALAACSSSRALYVESTPDYRSAKAPSTLLAVLQFAASLRDLPVSDQRALIEVYTSLPEDEASTEDSMRLALLYLSVSARPAELARAEALLADAAARSGGGEPELATFARVLLGALHTLPPQTWAPPAPAAPAAGDDPGELIALRRELEAERSRRMRLEAQLEALLQLELELGAGEAQGSEDANR